MKKECKYCGAKLNREDRDDRTYCDKSTCRSKYHQEIGRGYRGGVTHHLVHEDLSWKHPHTCDQCGKFFFVNDYAQRSGKRVPRFCSSACKMREYRGRKKDTKG